MRIESGCVVLFSLAATLAWAQEVRFVWESADYGKPGYAEAAGRIEQKVTPGKGACTLALKGRAQAKIVLAANPTRSAQVAARELQHYLEKITGANLPIVSDQVRPFNGPKVLVGESALTRVLGLSNKDFEEQEYLIRSYGDMLVLMGHDEQEFGLIDYEGTGLWPEFTTVCGWGRDPQYSRKIGSVYAVDEFLERCCGVRWYMPGELGEVCPRQETLRAADLDLRLRPWSDCRWYAPQNMRDYFHFVGSGRPDVSYASAHGWRDIHLWMMRMKVLGCEAYGCNHSLIGQWFKQRFKDRPEVWNEIKAKGYGEDPYELCWTSPKLLDIVVQDAKDYAAGKANIERAYGRYFPIAPHDTRNRCRCANCRKLLKDKPERVLGGFWTDPSTPYVWTLADKVARRLKQEEPGLWVSGAAYMDYAFPPDFELSDNVALTVTRVLVEYMKSPGYREACPPWIADWSKRVKRFYLWEYFDHIQSNGRERSFPGIMLGLMETDMRFLRSLGMKGAFNELNSLGGVPNFAQDHLNLYAWLKLIGQDRQEDLKTADLLDEYCRLFYGPAAAPMKQFFALAEERFCDPRNYRAAEGRWDEDVNGWAYVCPPPVLEEFGRLIATAKTLATEPPYRERVELMRQAVYGMMVKNCERFNFGHVRTVTEPDAPPRPFTILGDNPGWVTSPGGFALDAGGNLYVADAQGAQVLKFSPEGRVLLRIMVPAGVRGVCVDARNDLYVIGYRRLLKFRPDGSKALDFAGGMKHVLAENRDVTCVAVDARGTIWMVVDGGLEGFSRAGKPIETPAELAAVKRPAAVKAVAGTLYLLDSANRRVLAYDLAEGKTQSVAMDGKGPVLSALGVDGHGRIHVGMTGSIKVLRRAGDKYEEEAEYKMDVAPPRDIGFDPAGAAFIAGNTEVSKFDKDYRPLPAFGGKNGLGAGLRAGQLSIPTSVCTDGEGNLYTCELCDTKVQKLRPDVSVGKKENKMGQRASNTTDVLFDEVKLTAANVVGKEGEGFKVAMRTFDRTRPWIAAGAAGIIRRAMDESRAYSLERKTFGVPIAQHQAVQFMLAEMLIAYESTRLLGHKAAWIVDSGQLDNVVSSLAKAYGADAAMRVTTDAVQIFGGYGYTKEYPVEKLMRDAKLLQIYEGTSQVQRMVIARNLLGGK